MLKIKEIIPGLIVCMAIALVSHFLGKMAPSLGSASFAIFIGIFLGNTIFKSKKYLSGSKFSETDLLAYSIVLMGGTLSISSIVAIRFNGVIFIAIQMIGTILVSLILGKLLKFNKKYTYLMASGNAVCGSSAIAAVSEEIKPKEQDKGISITIVNITGTILMFLLPILATKIYGAETLKSSALIGGILQSIGQVIASAKFLTDDILNMATIFKIVRIIFLVIVVMIFGKLCEKESEIKKVTSSKKFSIKIPWFISCFFILCLFNSLIGIPEVISKLFKIISCNFEVIALAGIGMRVKFKDIIEQGPKSLLYGILIGISQMLIALTLISIIIKN